MTSDTLCFLDLAPYVMINIRIIKGIQLFSLKVLNKSCLQHLSIYDDSWYAYIGSLLDLIYIFNQRQ